MKKTLLKLLPAVMVLVVMFVSPIQASAQTLMDIDNSSSFARDSIIALAERGVISGDERGNFNPRNNVNRSEMVKMIVNALEISTDGLPETPSFTDVPKSHWAYKYVEAAYREGIVKGTAPGVFGVNERCTREQMAAMFVRSLGLSDELVNERQGSANVDRLTDKDSISAWAKSYVDFTYSSGLMNGTGNSTFGPQLTAERQEAAVVTERFISNKESVSNLAGSLREIRIVLNGDALNLENKPVMENGEVLVPLKVLERMGIEPATVDAEGIMFAERGTGPDGSGYIGLWLKEGEADAYIMHIAGDNPYLDRDSYIGNKAVLNAAPRKVNGELMIPVKFIAESLGADFSWNEKALTATVVDENSIEYPNLYTALKGGSQYKGEFEKKMRLNVLDNISLQDMTMDIEVSGAVNGENSISTSIINTGGTAVPSSSVQIESVKVGETVYAKNPETGEWEAATLEELESQGIPVVTSGELEEISNRLLDNYGRLMLVRNGNTVLDGQTVTKYTITIDRDMFMEIFPAEYFNTGVDMNEVYNNGFDFKIEIYLNSSDQVVKEVATFSGGTTGNGADITIGIVEETSYRKIGEDIFIEAPVL